MSAESALHNHHQKLWDQQKRRQKRGSKKNAKPEKALEMLVLEWALQKGLFLHVIEAKAVYSAAAARYLRGQAEAGIPDLIGNFGAPSVWIELKAKGRRGTLKEHQRSFLVRKVKQGCFAVCVDSVNLLDTLLNAFLNSHGNDRVQMLIDSLPKIRSFS